MKTAKRPRAKTLVNELLHQAGECLTPEVARRLVRLRADALTQARVLELAEKCNEGLLTAEERADYDAYVSASTFIGILQAKSRALLVKNGKSR